MKLGFLGGAAIVLTIGVIAIQSQHSDFYNTVESDPSWLAYLPPADAGMDLVPAGLNSEDATGNEMRRVDLVDEGHQQRVSLCFAESRTAVLTACPGSTFLGRSDRAAMALPAVAQIGQGSDSVDWMKLLNSPAPRLDDADYLD